MQRVAIVTGSRTPIGKAGKAYRDIHPTDLLRASFVESIKRAGVQDESVDRVLVGCTHQTGDQAINVGRNAWLAGGLSHMTPALTLDAQCCSGQEVASLASGLIASAQADVIVVGGVESLSRVPSGSTMAESVGNPYSDALTRLWDMPHQGSAGERVARKYGVTRRAADEYGVASHLRAAAAWSEGRLADEVVLVPGSDGPVLTTDEGIRAGASVESAADLQPAFETDGIITAANSSQLSDGAASLVLASETAVEEQGLSPLAWIIETTSTGADPSLMLEGPLNATDRLLQRTGLGIADFDAFEVHEAFAVPVLVWMDRFGVAHQDVNTDGGAIAMGHPFGASGARQLLHLAHHLRRGGGGRGIQTMCGGGGLGVATVLESA